MGLYAVALFAALATAGGGQTQDLVRIKAQLEPFYATWTDMMTRRDYEAARKFFETRTAAGFVFRTSKDQPLKRTQLISQVREQMVQTRRVLYRTMTITSLNPNGRQVTAKVLARWGSIMSSPGGGEVRLEVESESDHVWTSTGTGWLLKSVRVVNSKTKLDGKPYPA